MKNLLLILLVGLAIEANSQLTTYRTYYDALTRTKLHEEWTAKPSPNRARGVKHGLYKEFDAAGNLIREMQYADGKQNGYSKTYYFIPDPQQRPCYGKLIGDFNFKNGQRHGTQKDYRCDQGQMSLAKQTEYNEGQILSEVSYYRNGAKEYEKRYNGLNKEWNKGGQLIAEYNLVNGVESGLKVLYHDNGQVKMKGQMSDGNYSGDWVAYNADGSVLSRFTKDPDVYYFTYIERYSSKGTLIEKTEYVDGLHYMIQYDSLTGGMTREDYRIYSSETKWGVTKQKILHYPDAGAMAKFNYNERNGYNSIELYDKEGNRVGGGSFSSEGYPTGEFIVLRNPENDFVWNYAEANRLYKINFNETGDIIGVEEFDKNNTLTGKGMFWSNPGFQFVEAEAWEYYYSNGSIKEKGTFKNGRKDDEWTLYNQDGSLKAIQQYSSGELKKEQSTSEINAKAFADAKNDLISRYANYETRNRNPIVQFYQKRAKGTERYIIFEKGLVLVNHYFSRVQNCSDISCLETIRKDLELVESALKKYQKQSLGSLPVKLRLAKKVEKIEQLLLN